MGDLVSDRALYAHMRDLTEGWLADSADPLSQWRYLYGEVQLASMRVLFDDLYGEPVEAL